MGSEEPSTPVVGTVVEIDQLTEALKDSARIDVLLDPDGPFVVLHYKVAMGEGCFPGSPDIKETRIRARTDIDAVLAEKEERNGE